MEQTEYAETSAYKIETTGNYPEESIQRSEHGGCLKSRTSKIVKYTRHVSAQYVGHLEVVTGLSLQMAHM